MRTFYDAYAANNMAMMSTRFGFKSWEQVMLFHNYLEALVVNFLQQEGEYEVIQLAQLMNKHTNATLGFLNDALSLDITARLIASKIKAAKTSCESFFTNTYVGMTDEQAANNCKNVDVTDPNTIKGWLNSTWYGATYKGYQAKFISDNGFTDVLQLYKFFYMDPTTVPDAKGNFGDVYQQAITEIHDWYGCSFEAQYVDTCNPDFGPPASCRNCTGTELASLQWGEVGVTNNPKSDWDSEYLPK